MSSVLSTFLTIAVAFLIGFAPMPAAIAHPMVTPAVQSVPVAALPGLKGAFAGQRPENLGVHDGQLAACPESPNCVVSQGADEAHAIPPILYSSDRAIARQNLLDILSVVPRTKVVTQSDDYILVESESRLMGFVDDTEFYFPQGERVIQVRAAARLGESDLGVNRRRLEQIRLAFLDLEKRLKAE